MLIDETHGHLTTRIDQNEKHKCAVCNMAIMEFSRPVLDVIKARTSWRSYAPATIETSVKQRLISLIDEKATSPLGASCKLQWMTMEGADPAEKKKLGTYGVITGAREFIVGITSEGDMNAVQHLGYVLERVVLHATDAGLATCWLGGTFSRTGVADLVKAGAGDSIPAMTPVGYPTGHRHVVDIVVRLAIKAKARLPFECVCFDSDFGKPLDRSRAGDLELPLEAVRLGPSSKNGQPWRIVVAGNKATVHFYNIGGWHLDRGIAVCHFDLQAKEQGLAGTWRVEDPSITAPGGVNYVISWFKA